MSYWVAVVARNATGTLKPTLNSILNQTVQPKRIVAVDDGSIDSTAEMLSEFQHSNRGLVDVLTLPDRGYDIRRVPANINLACRASEASLSTEFFMISGDDCKYPEDYAETLIGRMKREPDIVVASGRPSSGGVASEEHVPSGSGRMIASKFWHEIGGRYPNKAGWETWLLYKAEERGFKVRLFDDLAFEHAHPRGAKHQFLYWGAAMQTLGYHPLYAMGRITKNMITRSMSPRGSMIFFRGYLQACLGSEDPFISPFEPALRRFISASQTKRIVRIVAKTL